MEAYSRADAVGTLLQDGTAGELGLLQLLDAGNCQLMRRLSIWIDLTAEEPLDQHGDEDTFNDDANAHAIVSFLARGVCPCPVAWSGLNNRNPA